LNQVIRGCIYLTASFLTAYIVVTVAEYYGNFDPAVRTALFYFFILLNGFILTKWIAIPLLSYYRLGKTISYEQASVIIGQHFQPVRDKLLNTLQLKKLADENPQQRSLIEASIDQKIAELKPVPFTSAVRIKENRRYLKYAGIPLGVIILIGLTAPSIFSESTERLLKHNQRFIKKAPFQFVVLNKSLTAVQGDDLVLEVKLRGNEIPDEVYLQDGPNTFRLEKENIVRFKHTFKNLQENKTVRLTGGTFSSDEYLIEVRRKPSLLNFDAHLDYPAYLNRKNETIDNAGDLTVPAGTKITLKLHAQNANSLEFQAGKRTARIAPDNSDLFTYSFRAMENSDYRIRPLNNEVQNADASQYQLRVIPDLHPVITVNEKRDSVSSNVLYFVGQVSDDHGFSRLNFHYRILGNNKAQRTSTKAISFDKNAIQSNFFHVWNANDLNAAPGEQIEYYFEVFDNDGVHGAKAARSQVKVLRLPTERELDQRLEAGSRSVKRKMEDAIRKAGQIEKEAKRLNQDLLQKKNLTYDEKKQVEQLLQKQKEFDVLVKDIQKENQQNVSDRQESREQREEIMEKQRQIEDLFNNVLDEKTREILRNIERLLEENNKNMTQRELSKMHMDNKSVQKELDRILELYKQLEFDQKMAESIDKLQKMAEEQQKLSEQTRSKKQDQQQLKDKQDELKKDFRDLEKDLKELEKKNEELSEQNDFRNPEKEQQQIEQQQDESSKNLENKNMNKAAENQQKAAEQMQQLAQQLESMQQQNEMQQNEINQHQLREILDNLVTSSFDQEKVMQELKNINSNDPGYTALAQKQKDIQDNLKMIEDSLYSLSRKVPQVESVVNKEVQAINRNIGQALENLSERRTAQANRNQQFAMTSINNLALMLSEVSEQLQRAMKNAKSGGKGGRQSLSQLSKMQEQLNRNMQRAREQMQKEGMQQNQPGQRQGKGLMSEQLAKMAREQQLIRQSLQEINRDLNKDGKGGLGNLDKLMKEMEQTETDLVNKRIRQETLIRQQDILSRLLEAEKAEREREQDNKLDSKEGRDFAPDYNIILQEYQKMKLRETELLRTVPPSLNSFYKNKVGDYFKFLNSGK
ncbi:MAG TPA: DUF4175 family protein, partial [Sphingobacteriaceae bacterium]